MFVSDRKAAYIGQNKEEETLTCCLPRAQRQSGDSQIVLAPPPAGLQIKCPTPTPDTSCWRVRSEYMITPATWTPNSTEACG